MSPGASFDPGSGYGIDASGVCGAADLLDVRFDTEGFLAQSFLLNAIGDSTYLLISHRQPEGKERTSRHPARGNRWAQGSSFFKLPQSHGINSEDHRHGHCYGRQCLDRHLDYMLRWGSHSGKFRRGGLFGISLATLNFDNKQFPTQTQAATITVSLRYLRICGCPQGFRSMLPEPATLLLLGAGLGVLGLAKRRVGKH